MSEHRSTLRPEREAIYNAITPKSYEAMTPEERKNLSMLTRLMMGGDQ